jgi:hypothetical protein
MRRAGLVGRAPEGIGLEVGEGEKQANKQKRQRRTQRASARVDVGGGGGRRGRTGDDAGAEELGGHDENSSVMVGWSDEEGNEARLPFTLVRPSG